MVGVALLVACLLISVKGEEIAWSKCIPASPVCTRKAHISPCIGIKDEEALRQRTEWNPKTAQTLLIRQDQSVIIERCSQSADGIDGAGKCAPSLTIDVPADTPSNLSGSGDWIAVLALPVDPNLPPARIFNTRDDEYVGSDRWGPRFTDVVSLQRFGLEFIGLLPETREYWALAAAAFEEAFDKRINRECLAIGQRLWIETVGSLKVPRHFDESVNVQGLRERDWQDLNDAFGREKSLVLALDPIPSEKYRDYSLLSPELFTVNETFVVWVSDPNWAVQPDLECPGSAQSRHIRLSVVRRVLKDGGSEEAVYEVSLRQVVLVPGSGKVIRRIVFSQENALIVQTDETVSVVDLEALLWNPLAFRDALPEIDLDDNVLLWGRLPESLLGEEKVQLAFGLDASGNAYLASLRPRPSAPQNEAFLDFWWVPCSYAETKCRPRELQSFGRCRLLSFAPSPSIWKANATLGTAFLLPQTGCYDFGIGSVRSKCPYSDHLSISNYLLNPFAQCYEK